MPMRYVVALGIRNRSWPMTIRNLPGSGLDGRLPTVYRWCMSRTNIDIDETACQAVMRQYGLATKREAVNFALRTLAAEPLTVGEARRLRGSGWEGDLDDMRQSRTG